MTRAGVIILAFLCAAYATATVAGAGLSNAAAEGDVIRDEASLLLALTAFAWFACGALFVSVLGRARRAAIAFWSMQDGLLAIGFLMTAGAGGIRVAPPLLLIG